MWPNARGPSPGPAEHAASRRQPPAEAADLLTIHRHRARRRSDLLGTRQGTPARRQVLGRQGKDAPRRPNRPELPATPPRYRALPSLARPNPTGRTASPGIPSSAHIRGSGSTEPAPPASLGHPPEVRTPGRPPARAVPSPNAASSHPTSRRGGVRGRPHQDEPRTTVDDPRAGCRHRLESANLARHLGRLLGQCVQRHPGREPGAVREELGEGDAGQPRPGSLSHHLDHLFAKVEGPAAGREQRQGGGDQGSVSEARS